MYKITHTELEKLKKGLEANNRLLGSINATVTLTDDEVSANESQMSKNEKLIEHLDNNYLKVEA
jgi:hypothetical protein